MKKLLATFALAALALAGCSSSLINAHPLPKATASPTTPPVQSVASIRIVPQGPGLQLGAASSFLLAVTAYDADGNALVAPYPSPITIISTTSSLALSRTSLTANGQPITVAYNGGTIPPNTVIVASTGLASSSLGLAVTGPSQPNAIASINLVAPGAAAISDAVGGAATLDVVAYDSSNTLIQGAYPTTVQLTSSNTPAVTFNGNAVAAVASGGTQTSLVYAQSTGSFFHGTVITATTINTTSPVSASLTL